MTRRLRFAPTTWGLVVVVVVGASLRVARLAGYDGLVGDEGYTLALAQRAPPHMFELFAREANGLLLPLLLSPAVRVGDWLWLLRSPAVIAGILAIPALYWTGTRLADRRAALAAAALLALNPVAIAYSQLARAYIFAMLFGILSFGFLARFWDDAARRNRLGYVISTVLGAYSHALVLPMLLPAQIPLVLARGRSAVGTWIRAVVVVGIAVAPLAVLLAVSRSKRNPLYWLDRPSLEDAKNVALALTAGKGGFVVCFAAVAAAIAVDVRRRCWNAAWPTVLAWGLVPLPLLFMLSQISPAFWIDYTLPALPGVLLLVAYAALRLPRPAAAVALVALGAVFTRAAVDDADAYHPNGWRTAAHELSAARESGDPVLFDIPDGLVAAGYYDASLAAADGKLVVSEWRDRRLPPGVVLRDDPGGYGRVPPGPPTRADVAGLARRTGTLHVVLSQTARQGDVENRAGLAWAAKRCRVTRRAFGGIRMLSITGCPIEGRGEDR